MNSILRIIGGKWRSRKISFMPIKGLRPTTDINREALFNWLQPFIVGAKCLDLFAGSGALSFEAISRGAATATLVDAAPEVIAQLKKNIQLLEADNAFCYCARIPERLKRLPNNDAFDIIFIDPPFNYGLVERTCAVLATSPFIKPTTLIYIECERSLDINAVLPANWQIIKNRHSNLANCFLITVHNN